MNTESPFVSVSKVSYAWGSFNALKDVSVCIQAGELFGLLGPNGAGKTTLISLLAGLLHPSHGSLQVMGLDIQQHALQIRAQMGFVFQSISLDRFMTVRQNLEFAAGLQGLNDSELSSRLEELNTHVKFSNWLSQPVGALSGGQKRLVDIVRAMLHKPSLLILDEPTTALDPASKQAVWELLQHLKACEKLTILIATHLMDEAKGCDRVAFLQNGLLKWEGTPLQALDEMPNQEMTTSRQVTLSDWFIWKMNQGSNHELTHE